jgi:hypothetical protein
LITGSTASTAQPIQGFVDDETVPETDSPDFSESLEDDVTVTGNFSETAAIAVVRDMSHIILGTTPGSSDEGLADCVSIGLIDEGFCNRLFDG